MGYWDEEKDIVWIDPKNTKGQVLKIAGLNVGLPKVPAQKDILFSDLPIDEQMWVREEMPDELQAIEDWEGEEGDKRSPSEVYNDMPKAFKEKWNPWIAEQYRKRKEGVWFMNKGKPIYLTGEQWFVLQWIRAPFGYLKWFEPQWRLGIHWEACVLDPRCYGQNFVKNRRFGWTTGASGGLTEYITRTKNADVAIGSKSEKDAEEVIFQGMFMYMFNELPFFFTPLRRGSRDPKKMLELKAPSGNISKNNKVKKATGLNSRVVTLQPKTSSGDGMKIFRLVMDESGKLEKPHNIEKSWQVKKRCLEERNKIIGKCRMGSTVNPMAKGGAEYKSLFFDGLLEGDNVKGRNGIGRTLSGMYSIFIPAYECIIYDKHGYSVVDDPKEPIETIDGDIVDYGGKTYLNRVREGLKGDPIKYNEEIRQMPFTVREAFMDTLDDCLFNLQKIEEQSMYNDTLPPNTIIKGNFGWANGRMDGKVVWNPDNKGGRFKIAWLPKPEMQSIINNKKRPPHGWLGVGGVDSYDIDQTAYGSGSKGALHLYVKSNPYNAAASNMFVLEYVNRPKTVDVFYEDVLMASVFYGFPLLIEGAKYSIAHYFNNRGYGNYLMTRPYKSFNPSVKPSASERAKKGLPVSGESIRQLDMLLEAYVENHVGYNEEGEIGNLLFNETLKQLKEYDPNDRTKSDAVVSAGHALYAAEVDIRKQEDSHSGSSKPLFRRFKV